MVSTAEMGVQTMNKQSDQNKTKSAKDELNEKDLNKVSGGLTNTMISGVKSPLQPVDGAKLPGGPKSPLNPVDG